MSIEPSSKVSASQSPIRRGHEHSDAHAGWIFGVVFFLVICGLIIHFVMAATLTSFIRKPLPKDQWRPPSPPAGMARTISVFPRLQISPSADLERFRAREQAELHSYGWINP